MSGGVEERVYWMVSLPILGGGKESTWDQVQQMTVYAQDLSNNFKLNVPETLRVGTLDSLMELSDELVRYSASIEGTTSKLRRQRMEVKTATSSNEDLDPFDIESEDASAIESFVWNEAKFPSNRPLKETVERIMEGVSRVDDALKMRLSEYHSSRTNLASITRRTQGSLAVREIGSLVKAEDFVESENLTTVMAVVPVHSRKEFLAKYEKWASFSFLTDAGSSARISAAVPRSASIIAEDKDYLLIRIVVFSKMVDTFKTTAREAGFQIRDYHFNAQARDKEKENQESLINENQELGQELSQWSLTAYKEVLESWMHLLTIRLFVESILRYGLPPSFQAAVIKPNKRAETKVRAVLYNQFCGIVNNHWKNTETDGGKASASGESDIYPYISFTVNFNK